MMDFDLPEAFVNRVKNDPFLGENLLSALQGEAPTSLRFNPSKAFVSGEGLKPVTWCKNAFYLAERPVFTLDPHFHAGAYYPQEAGSMMLDKVLRQLDLTEESVILDLCAAPGGKSTLIASYLNGKGLLVSNEVIHSRASILKENLCKWGFTNTIVTSNDPADFSRLPGLFDVVLIDAPCSGEGMFRKDKAARSEWSEDHVALCASRQKRIVLDVWESLKPGGILIYATCTFNTQENEQNVEWICKETGATIEKLDFSPFKTDRNAFGAYALPSEVDTEGFYIAVMRKSDEAAVSKAPKIKQSTVQRVKDESAFDGYVQPGNHTICQWNDIYFALPILHYESALLLQQQLKIVKFGTELGSFMKGKLIPDTALALNPALLAYLHRIELDKNQALHYLKGEVFALPAEKKLYLVTFEGQPLGWINHLGNRFNNLYPTHWRIRMKI